MPELTVTHIAIIAGALLIGIVLGWVARGNRAQSEKDAIHDGWQEQLEAQRQEHERLLEQNKSLMDQNSQYQASNKDAKMRASELSDALKEAFERRDELQRQLKDIRGNLETAVSERDQLRSDVSDQVSGESALEEKLARREQRIEKLNAELKNWQDRLPPLIEKFRIRNEEATQLESELAEARERIGALETMVGSDQTRVEPVDADALGDSIDASNEPLGDTMNDQIDDLAGEEADLLEAGEYIDNEDHSHNDAPHGDNSESASEPALGDDLKLIKGVGPAIEKTLNELGIRRFEQIAAMSEYDIDRVANRLKGFRSRIYREDWIGQARDLQDQKVSNQ